MPRASTSRRRLTRQEREVEEEEEEQSDVEMEGADEEEDAPRRKVRNSQQSSQHKQGQRAEDAMDEDEDEEEEEEEEEIDLDNLQDQPISKQAAQTTLNGLVAEWDQWNNQIKLALEGISSSATDLEEVNDMRQRDMNDEERDDDEIEDDSGEAQIREADSQFRAVLDIAREIELRKRALQDLRSDIVRGNGTVANLGGQADEKTNEALNLYRAKTQRQRFGKDKQYEHFRSLIWEVAQSGSAPPAKTFLPREAGDEEESDEDIEIGMQTQIFKDPMTLVWLVDPLKSPNCPHAFSKEVIHEYIRKNGPHMTKHPTIPDGQIPLPPGQCVCPVTGCQAILTLNDLVEDPELAKRVEGQKRREKEREDRAYQPTQVGGKAGPSQPGQKNQKMKGKGATQAQRQHVVLDEDDDEE